MIGLTDAMTRLILILALILGTNQLRAEKFTDKGWMLDHRDKVKPELIWQVEQGLGLAEGEVARARAGHEAIVASTAAFFEDFDLLVCPCTMTPPFDVKIRWLKECCGWAFDSYIDWLMPTSVLSLTNCPSICVPCGFTAAGLPVGLQMVARPNAEAQLLCAAHAFEQSHPLKNCLNYPDHTKA